MVLSVNQDFFNGAISGYMRFQSLHTMDREGRFDPIIVTGPLDAKAAGLMDEQGVNFASSSSLHPLVSTNETGGLQPSLMGVTPNLSYLPTVQGPPGIVVPQGGGNFQQGVQRNLFPSALQHPNFNSTLPSGNISTSARVEQSYFPTDDGQLTFSRSDDDAHVRFEARRRVDFNNPPPTQPILHGPHGVPFATCNASRPLFFDEHAQQYTLTAEGHAQLAEEQARSSARRVLAPLQPSCMSAAPTPTFVLAHQQPTQQPPLQQQSVQQQRSASEQQQSSERASHAPSPSNRNVRRRSNTPPPLQRQQQVQQQLQQPGQQQQHLQQQQAAMPQLAPQHAAAARFREAGVSQGNTTSTASFDASQSLPCMQPQPHTHVLHNFNMNVSGGAPPAPTPPLPPPPPPAMQPPAEPPSHMPPSQNDALSSPPQPYVANLLSGFYTAGETASITPFLLSCANAMLDVGMVSLLYQADGTPDVHLLRAAVEDGLRSIAASHSPPRSCTDLIPNPLDGTVYQQAVSAFRRFYMAAKNNTSATVNSESPPPQHTPAPAASLQPQHLIAPSRPSRPVASVPADQRGIAVHTALLLDRVAADNTDATQMEALAHLLKTNGPNDSTFQEAVKDASPNVSALLGLDVELVQPEGHGRVYETYMYARVLVKARGAAVREVLRERERMLVPASVEPAPDFDKFTRYIQAGQLLLITEAIIAAQPNASTKALFAGGFTEADRTKAFTRVEVVLKAYGEAFPAQKALVSKALRSFELLCKECMEARIEMKTLHDSVWVPFARGTQRRFQDSREVIGGPTPLLLASDFADDSPFIRKLFRSHAFNQQSRPVLLPPPTPLAPAAAAPPRAAAPQPCQPAPQPTPSPRPPVRPPMNAQILFNPLFPSQPNFQPLPNPKPPHKPMINIDCRGWTAGKCSFGTACKFMHPGY